MLITDRNSPMVAKHDIKCFKVMVELDGVFYVCPPAYQYFLQNNKLVKYHLNTLYCITLLYFVNLDNIKLHLHLSNHDYLLYIA